MNKLKKMLATKNLVYNRPYLHECYDEWYQEFYYEIVYSYRARYLRDFCKRGYIIIDIENDCCILYDNNYNTICSLKNKTIKCFNSNFYTYFIDKRAKIGFDTTTRRIVRVDLSGDFIFDSILKIYKIVTVKDYKDISAEDKEHISPEFLAYLKGLEEQ